MNTPIQPAKKSVSPLFLIILMFVVPMLLAWLLYSHPSLIGLKKQNKGDLVQPSFSITQFTLYNEHGQRIDNHSNQSLPPTPTRTNGQWLLMLFIPKQCDYSCVKSIYTLRQLRLAMGAEQERVERAVLTYQNSYDPELILQVKNYFGTRLLRVNQNQFAKIIQQYVNKPYALNQGTIYIVDPNGNFVMSYHPNVDAMNIYKDLKQLLRVSQIG